MFEDSTLPVINYYASKGKVRKVNYPFLLFIGLYFTGFILKATFYQFLDCQVDAGKPVEEVFDSIKAIFSST